jgi:hypothetical protein
MMMRRRSRRMRVLIVLWTVTKKKKKTEKPADGLCGDFIFLDLLPSYEYDRSEI